MDLQRIRDFLAHDAGNYDTLRPNQVNKYRAAWAFATGRHDLDTIPSALQFARNNKCNFKCVYCSEHREGNTVPRVELNDQTWDMLAELLPRAEYASFHGISEFMIDPKFFEIVGKAAAARAILFINTNGSVCTEKHVQCLADYPGKLVMNFSLDAATPRTYLRIRGWDFFRVVENIHTYVDRLAFRRDRTSFAMSFVVARSNVHEMVPAVYLAKTLGMDTLKFLPLLRYGGLDWVVPTKEGGTFAYHEEELDAIAPTYNQAIEDTKRAAQIVQMMVEIPSLLQETPDLVEVGAPG